MKTLLHRLLPVFLCLGILGGCASLEKNGLGHGLAVGAISVGAGYVIDTELPDPKHEWIADTAVSAIALGLAAYYIDREHEARDRADFDEWYFDSQMDAAVPLSVALGTVLWRWLYEQ